MKTPSKNDRHVLLLLWKGGASGRDFLQGFLQFARTRRNWHVHIRHAADCSHRELQEAVTAGDYHGIVTGERALEVFPELAANPQTKLVIFGTYVERPDLPQLYYVQNDNSAIGRYGAESLMQMGSFASFGFVPTNCTRGWSELRAAAFQRELARHGKMGRVFQGHSQSSLRRWLTDLPKPAALMAACDTRALEVVEACLTCGIRVPDQMAVLGVDNDELVCELATPMLSSILPQHTESGRLAAVTLNRLFRNRPPAGPHRILCSAQALVERESTAPVSPVAHLIAAALSFIHTQAPNGISVADVARHLRVSRALLDLRFREYHGASVGKTILETRYRILCRRLAQTSLPIAKAARLAGFNSPAHLADAFRRRFGMTMSEWRRRNAVTMATQERRADRRPI